MVGLAGASHPTEPVDVAAIVGRCPRCDCAQLVDARAGQAEFFVAALVGSKRRAVGDADAFEDLIVVIRNDVCDVCV